jgi:hypothetical protein
MSINRTKVTIALAAGLTAGALLAPGAAFASGGGGGGSTAPGSTTSFCDGGSTLAFQATPSGSSIRLSLKVNTPFSNRNWTASFTDNGVVAYKVTKFITGNSFTVDASIPNKAGADSITINAGAAPLQCEPRTVTV